MAEMEFSPPKYAQIVCTIQRRIGDGTYPAGGLLPSETQLMREFGVSRPDRGPRAGSAAEPRVDRPGARAGLFRPQPCRAH